MVSAPSSTQSSPPLSQASLSNTSYFSTPASSVSLDTKAEVEYEEDILFPSYNIGGHVDPNPEPGHGPVLENAEPSNLNHSTPTNQYSQVSILKEPLRDDNSIEREPTRHVDYLSHVWKEEDIWASWRYITKHRKTLKDCDVTWLYGPLQTEMKKPLSTTASPPPSRLSKTNSFSSKKPILKKKSASEAILQRSVSTHSLLRQAGAILQAQEMGTNRRPQLHRASSDFSSLPFSRASSLETPTDGPIFSSLSSESSSGLTSPSERRHIHFDNEVKQMIAVEGKDDGDEDEEILPPGGEQDEEEDEEEDLVTMKEIPSKAKMSNRSTPRGSFSKDGKTIAPLPSTTLNYRGDTPEPEKQVSKQGAMWQSAPSLSSSASQETLRPSRPSANFLLDDDDEADLGWSPSGLSTSSIPTSYGIDPAVDEYNQPGPGMRRTESGMFMPYEEDEDEAAMNNTLFGRVVDTVNTMRDIGHVIWNVGWKR
ncbi:MAG: hypothetical protein Q9227_003583 [Pyrenula ochraceoflavens]